MDNFDPTKPPEGQDEVSLEKVVNESLSPLRDSGIEEVGKLNELFEIAIHERYSTVNLSKDEARKVKRFMTQLREGGSSGVRLICAGDNCEYRKACPLWQTKVGQPVQISDPLDPTGQSYSWYQPTKAPIGQECPLEATVVLDTRIQMVNHPGIDMSNAVHKAYVNELCLLSSLEWRCNMLLAFDHHPMVMEVPAAISPTGTVHTKYEMNQLIEVLSRINDRRSRIMRELTVSPESEYKRRKAEGGGDGDSLSRVQAAQRAQIKNAERLPNVVPVPDHVKSKVLPSSE